MAKQTKPRLQQYLLMVALLLVSAWPVAEAQPLREADSSLETDDRWGLAYLDAVLPEMSQRSAACAVSAASRFFAEQGGNYTLNLGGGSAEIVGRGTWGAGPVMPEGRSWVPYPAASSVCGWISRITVHHTHRLYTPLSLQVFHQTLDDPKADIAYHFFIDAAGIIYEGRPLGFMGSHSERDNSNNVGIALNGDFNERLPGDPQLNALRRLLVALRCPCAPLEGIWTHQQRNSFKFPGDPAYATDCPGQQMAGEVYGLAAALGVGPLTRSEIQSP
jgi:hypothetical protein